MNRFWLIFLMKNEYKYVVNMLLLFTSRFFFRNLNSSPSILKLCGVEVRTRNQNPIGIAN